MSVGLLVWATILGVVGATLVIASAFNASSPAAVFAALMLLAGIGLIGLAAWYARRGDGLSEGRLQASANLPNSSTQLKRHGRSWQASPPASTQTETSKPADFPPFSGESHRA